MDKYAPAYCADLKINARHEGKSYEYVRPEDRITIGFGRAGILVFDDPERLMRKAESYLFGLLRSKPDSVICFPTGDTFKPFYKHVSENYNGAGCSFRKSRVFSVDEYIGMGREDPGSYAKYMDKHLFSKVDVNRGNVTMPNGLAEVPAAEAEDYEKAISAAGGIDLLYLGVGINGHVGFNEPGSSFGSKTRVVGLSDSTIRTNSRFFGKGTVPEDAITIGMSTIFSAKQVVVLATGPSKARIMREISYSGVTEELPATMLKEHKNAVFLLDSDAGKGVRLS